MFEKISSIMSSSTHSNGETRIRSANDAEFQKNNRPIFSTSCCTILLLAVITVLMQLLLIMNTTSPSSNNNNLSMMMMSSGAMDDHQQPVLGETQQDDYSTQHNKMDSHVQQRYFEKVTTIKDRERLVSLGQLLLRQGDAIGAFSSCTSVFTTEIVEGGESRPSTDLKDLMDAFVCAGEASIKLYKDALELLHDEPQSSLTPPSTTTSRIEQAKSYFEIAMDLDPMNPRVRTGLGLSLFFIATAPNTDDKYNKSHKSLLLFEAIQHFTTAASYYHKGNREETNDDTIAMQRSCWYNAAFCYIHLQHYSEAIPLLQRAINTHPTDSAEYNTGTNEILSVITEIEKLRYALEAQRLKLEQLLQHATVVLSPKGFNTIQTEIDVDTTALRTPKVMLPSIPDNDMPPSAVADGVAIASTDSSEREPIHSSSQGVADAVQLVSDNVTAESKSTHKIALPSSSDDETIESVTSDYISLESTVKTKASLSSDSDLSTNVVADSDIDASCNDSLMQPVLSSSDDDLGTRDTLNATNNSFLQSMDESGPLLLNPEGISVEDVAIQAVLVDASAANLSSSNVTIFSSSDGDGSAPVESILGDDTNLMNDTKVEALPPSDHAVAINTVIDGDTASSSTDAKVDIVSSLVDDRNKHDLTDDNSSLRQLIFPFENDSFVANTSFSKVTLLSPSDEYVRNEPVIGENTAPVSTAEIDSLLPSGNNVAVNAVTDADTAANVFGTTMETLALSDEYIIYKQEQVNENSGLPPLSESLDDSAAQVTSQRDDVKEEETLMPLLYNNDDDAAKVETNATVDDGKDPTLGASTEYELLLQPSFSSPNMTGNTSLNLDVDIPPFSVDDDSASSNVLGDSEDVMSSAKLYDSKDEYKLDLEGKIELPLLYNATPRLNEEVNLSYVIRFDQAEMSDRFRLNHKLPSFVLLLLKTYQSFRRELHEDRRFPSCEKQLIEGFKATSKSYQIVSKLSPSAARLCKFVGGFRRRKEQEC